MLKKEIKQKLLNHGFSLVNEVKYFSVFTKLDETIYLKKTAKRQPLVVHPKFRRLLSPGSGLLGVSTASPFQYYHHSGMRAFPKRLHTGKKPNHFGIALHIEESIYFDRFLREFEDAQVNLLTDDILEVSKSEISETEKGRLISARIGQGKFRSDLIIEFNQRCALTNISKLDLLKASHIKPWRDATDTERLDPKNGLLLAVHLDALFDSGLIGFNKDGKCIISNLLSCEEIEFYRLKDLRNLNYSGREKYLAYHLEYVFQ